LAKNFAQGRKVAFSKIAVYGPEIRQKTGPLVQSFSCKYFIDKYLIFELASRKIAVLAVQSFSSGFRRMEASGGRKEVEKACFSILPDWF
jgi:hypothetical protein